jgi:predicted nuclease of predicted toxin-antitoxin system
VKFLIDSMLPPQVADKLNQLGHDAVPPTGMGVHNLPDEVLIELASAEGRVIVTENASDFARATASPVLLVRKSWWPTDAIASRVVAALDRWGAANPAPGCWAHWLESELR